MKEGGGALQATPRTHHVGKERDGADGEIVCNADPVDEMQSLGNGSGDLEDSRKEEERFSAEVGLEETTCNQDGSGESTNAGIGAQPKCDVDSKQSLPQPHEANATVEEPSSEFTSQSIPEESSDRTKPERAEGTGSDEGSSEVSVACGDLKSSSSQEANSLDQRDAASDDKCTLADEQLTSGFEDPLLELGSVEALMKSLEDQMLGTPNLAECVNKSLYAIDKEQSLEESLLLEGPKRAEEALSICASALGADSEPKEEESKPAEESVSNANQDCQDFTLGSILSACSPLKDDVSLGLDKSAVPAKAADEVLPEEAALMTDNELLAENNGASGTEEVSLEDDKEDTTKDSPLDDDELEDIEESSPATENGLSQEDSKVILQHDKGDLLADEGLSLESVSETSFTLNDNTEDGKDGAEIEMEDVSLKDSVAEDTQDSVVEKGASKDFMAELEDISSEDNEDFFADMDSVSLLSNKDSMAEKEPVPLDCNEDSVNTTEAVSLEATQGPSVEKESLSTNEVEETSAETDQVSAERKEDSEAEDQAASVSETKDSVSEKVGGFVDDIMADASAGDEAVSLDCNEDSVATTEAVSLEATRGSSVEKESLSTNEVEETSAETDEVSAERKEDSEAEDQDASVSETKDSVSEKVGGFVDDIMAGMEAVSTDDNEDSLAGIEALSMDATDDLVTEEVTPWDILTDAVLLNSVPKKNEVSPEQCEDTEAISVESNKDSLAEEESGPSEENSNPQSLDFRNAEEVPSAVAEESPATREEKETNREPESALKSNTELALESENDSLGEVSEELSKTLEEPLPDRTTADAADGETEMATEDTLCRRSADAGQTEDDTGRESPDTNLDEADQQQAKSDISNDDTKSNDGAAVSELIISHSVVRSDIKAASINDEEECASQEQPSQISDSQPLPSEQEESTPEPLPAQEDPISEPFLSEVEECPSVPTAVEESSASLPSEVEENSAVIPSEVEESSPPSPSEEDGSSALVRRDVSASPPVEEHGSSPVLSSEKEENSEPVPSDEEEKSALLEEEGSSALIPSESGENSAPLIAEEKLSAPSPSEADECAVPPPSEVVESSVPSPSNEEESSTSTPLEKEEISAPSPVEKDVYPVPPASEAVESLATSPSEEEKCSDTPLEVEESPADPLVAVDGSSVESPVEVESSPAKPPVEVEANPAEPPAEREVKPTEPSVEVASAEPPVEGEVTPAEPPVEKEVKTAEPPTEVEVTPAEPLMEMEVTPAKSPAGKEESSANPPAEVEESSANPPAEVEESSANTPAEVEESLANTPAEVEESLANPPAEVEESSVNTPAEAEGSPVKLPLETEESLSQPPVEMEESSANLPLEEEESSGTLSSEQDQSEAAPTAEAEVISAPASSEEKDDSPSGPEAEESSEAVASESSTGAAPVSKDIPQTTEAPSKSVEGDAELSRKPEDKTSPAITAEEESSPAIKASVPSEKPVADAAKVQPEKAPVAVPKSVPLEIGKSRRKFVKKEAIDELDIPLENLKQEELDIPSEPLDEDDLDEDELLDNDESTCLKSEDAADGDFEESALVIDEGEEDPPLPEDPAIVKREAIKVSLGSEVSIKLVPAKSNQELREKSKVQSLSIIPKDNLLKTPDYLQRRAKAQSLVKTTAPTPGKARVKVSKAPIPDLTPLQSELAKATPKVAARSAKSTQQKAEKNPTVKSLLKAPPAAGPAGKWPPKGKSRSSEDFRPFPSLPKDTVVIPTYYVSEQEKAQQPINLSTSNDMPMISKSIPASQPLPANVVPSQREKVIPSTTSTSRAHPTKNVMPLSGPPPLPMQSMMPKMDNNMFPAMWSLFGPQLLSSPFFGAGVGGPLPPFPMDPQKQNLLGAMFANSAMPRLPIPPEMNVFNSAMMQMHAQMDALMQPKLPDMQNAPMPPDMSRYDPALMQLQAQMEAFLPLPPNAPPMAMGGLPPVLPPAVPPVPPFAKAKQAPQVKPQATIHPQPKVPPKPAVQLGNLAQSSKTAQPAAPRKPGGRKTKFTPGSSPRLVKRPTSAAATAVAAGLKIPVPAVNASSRPPAPPAGSPVGALTSQPSKPSSPVVAAPPTSKKFKVGSKLNSVVDKLLAGAGKQGSAVDLSAAASSLKSSSPVPPRKDTPPMKDAPPVKKVIQVTNALTIELENRNDARERRVRPPMPALLPCKPAEPSPALDETSRGVAVNGCVSDLPPVVLTPEQARKSVETSGLTVELVPPPAEDDAMSVTCSLPLDKVSVILDSAKKSPVPSSGLPTLPPTLAAGGLEILPMDIAKSATSTPKPAVPEIPIGANSISLGSNVSLTLAQTSQEEQVEPETPIEELSAIEPGSAVAEEDAALEPTPSPPQLEPVSSPLKRPAGVQDETLSPDKEVPSLDLEVPEGLETTQEGDAEDGAASAAPEDTPVASKAGRKKFSFTVNSSFMMTLSDGQKLFTCDICSGVYQRAFSLKRHYLRSHINYIHLQERDISNCGIIVGNKMAVQTEPNTKVCLKDSKITVVSTDEESQEALSEGSKEEETDFDLPGLYRCYTCGVCFDLKEELRSHLSEHKPSSNVPEEEEGAASKENLFSCEVCAYPFRHKKNYLRHMEVCSKRKQSSDQSEWLCLFCNKTFSSAAVRSRHLSCIHRRLRPGLKKSRRSKVQKHSCMYCGALGPKFNDLNSLLKHMCTTHQDVYFGCLLCEERFPSKDALEEHTNATHTEETEEAPEVPGIPEPSKSPEAPAVAEEVEEEAPAPPPAPPAEDKGKKSDAFQFVCSVCKKMFVNEMNMSRHKQLAHGGPRGKKKRRAGNATRPPTPPVVPEVVARRKEAERMDPEALFYSRLSMQIRDNLMHHLDGKLDSQEVFEREEEEPLVVKNEAAPTPPPAVTAQQEPPESAVDPSRIKNIPRRRSSESYLRLTWDKFNVQKDKDSRSSVSSFIRDMSHIDIATQLIMRRNMKRLSEIDSSKLNLNSGDDVHRLAYPACISLTQSADGARSLVSAVPESLVNSMLSVTTRVESEEASTSTAPEPPPKTPLNPAEDFLNGPWKNKDLSNEVVELSGEWVRPKHYLCAACDSAFLDNLYEMEDHQYLMHPNVWGTYWEFEESTLVPFKAAGITSPSSLYQRSLKPTGSLISAPPHPSSQTKDIACTKCSRLNHSVPELHRHMLDCGGDTTWHLTMVLSSPVNGRRNRKWRPFGSRRRRQQGRRGLKRNIPNTPQRPRTNQPKTSRGDAETIQRMIANLPAKRSTRRVIQFKEDDLKTRSQSAMAGTRLLRKRFKVPFPVSQSPLHKASRALLGRSMASSSSKPGHMPRARPLRTSTSAAAAIAAAAAAARKASKVQSPPKNQPAPQEVAHTLVQVQTLIPAKVRKLAKAGKAGKAKVSPNASVEAIPGTSEISVEDIPEGLPEGSPDKGGEKNTDVILEAMRKAMMTANFHLCSVCGRMFNNSGNRDRHFRVCSAQAAEGMPRLRKEGSTPRSRQSGKNTDIPVLSPNATVAPSGDSSKAAKSGEAAPNAEPPSAEPSGSGKKKKKRTIVGIRKSLVKSQESGLVVTESFLVRVDSSSNETSETEAKDKAEDEMSDDVFDKKAKVEATSPKKKKKGAKQSKVEATVEPAVEVLSEGKKKKKKSKVANEEEVPVKKLTRSKQASPQKVPVMRVDRSANADTAASDAGLPAAAKADDLPADADPDNLDFEELLNTMDAEEIKQLDMMVGTPLSDADDDIPLGKKASIWKKEAEAQEDISSPKAKKGTKRRASDIVLPAPKKTRSSSMLAEEMVEAIEIEVEEPKKSRASKSPAAAKGRKKSQLEDSIAMPPPSVQESPKVLAKNRRRSSVKAEPPVIVPAEVAEVVEEPKPEVVPAKGGKKKGKAAAKVAETVANVVEPPPEPEQVVPSGKKKTKAAKQAESVVAPQPEVTAEPVAVPKTKSKGSKTAQDTVKPESDVIVEPKPVTKKLSKKALKALKAAEAAKAAEVAEAAKVAEAIEAAKAAEAAEIAKAAEAAKAAEIAKAAEAAKAAEIAKAAEAAKAAEVAKAAEAAKAAEVAKAAEAAKAAEIAKAAEAAKVAELAEIAKAEAAIVAEVVAISESAVNEEVSPVLKKKTKGRKSAANIQPEADLVQEVKQEEAKPGKKKKAKALKPAEKAEEIEAPVVQEVKPATKRKYKKGAKPAVSELVPAVPEPEPQPEIVPEEHVEPAPPVAEVSEPAPEPSPVLTPVATPTSKKKSKKAKAAEAAEAVADAEPAVTGVQTPVSRKKTKAKLSVTPNAESETPPADVKPASKKKSKTTPKPAEAVIEPDPNLVGELTPRNRKRIQPLEGDVKKAKGKAAENPSSPAVATPEVAPTPPVATKKGKAPEEPAAPEVETSPVKEPEKKESVPVKRKGKKRASLPVAEETEENVVSAAEKPQVLPEDSTPKVNRKRPRSVPAEGEPKPSPKGRGKKKAKMDSEVSLISSEEAAPVEAIEKPKASKKKAVVKTEPEEPVASETAAPEPAVAPAKPKKKSKSKAVVEVANVDEEALKKDSEPSSGVTPISETEQAKSSECAAAPTPSTPMDPPAANSPTPGEQPDISPKKRKSSLGSQFFCDLCQRHYSTAYNLTKHLSSLSHRALVRVTQPEIDAASGDEGKTNTPEVVAKTKESDKAVDETLVSNEEQPLLESDKEPTLPTPDVPVAQPVLEPAHPQVQSEEKLVQNVEETPQEEEPNPAQEPMITEQPSESSAVVSAIEKAPEQTFTALGEVHALDDAPPVPAPAQASLVQGQNQFQQDYAPIHNDMHQQGYSQEQPYPEQQYNCYDNRTWQGDSGWGPWRIPDASDDMSSNMGFGLGSILDSVNQVLAGDGGGTSDLPDAVYSGYALNEIQNAVGATDEEMAVLRQLGEGSFEELVGAPGSVMWAPPEETQLLDLDNQRPNQPPESEKTPSQTPSTPLTSRKRSKSPAPSTSGAATPTKTPVFVDAIPSTSSRDDTRSPVSMMPRPKTAAAGGNSLNELYEDRQMWCPSCHRRFLGLQAMKAHMAQHHSQNQRVDRKAKFSAEGSSEHRIICEVCREMVVDQVALELHMEELHSGHNDPSKAVPASPSPGAKSRVLRLQMSHALGGLLDRALKNYLSKSTTGAASSVDTDRSRFTLGLLNKLALRHQANAANQSESPRSTPNPMENDGDGASSHSGSTTPTNTAPKRRNSRTEPMFVQYQGHPCPYCSEKFMSDAFVKRHVNNVHAHLVAPEPSEDNLSDTESRAGSPMEFCADPVVGDDGAFLCSSCGINFKSPREVLEHQRAEHPEPTPEELAKLLAESEENARRDAPVVRVIDNVDPEEEDDVDSAEIAEKVSELQQRVSNPFKGRAVLTKDLKNKKIALAVESALLEHTAEVQVIAEAALRELGPCRKAFKSNAKESPKWGIDAVKFTVAKEPALVGAYGPVSEQESRLKSIPIVRKTPSSAPRFSFAERKKLSKPSTKAKPVKEKMEIYEFDESPRVEPLTFELKREVEDKSSKDEGSEAQQSSAVSDIFSVVEIESPKPAEELLPKKTVEEAVVKADSEETPKKAPAKKRQSTAKRKGAPGKDEGTPAKVAKVEKKKIFKKRKSDQGESSKSSEGPKSRTPRAEKAEGEATAGPSGRARKQRRASTHDATDYSVFDFSSDESSVGAVVEPSAEASAPANPPRAPRRESVSPPKKATPSRVQELVEEDWTWLDDSESEKEKRKKLARRKRTKKKSDSPKKQSASRENLDVAEEDHPSKAVEETAATTKRRKRSEAGPSAGAGSSEGAR